MALGIGYVPTTEQDFQVIQKISALVEAQSQTCEQLQTVTINMNKYTQANYSERVRYMAGMAQEFADYYRPL